MLELHFSFPSFVSQPLVALARPPENRTPAFSAHSCYFPAAYSHFTLTQTPGSVRPASLHTAALHRRPDSSWGGSTPSPQPASTSHLALGTLPSRGSEKKAAQTFKLSLFWPGHTAASLLVCGWQGGNCSHIPVGRSWQRQDLPLLPKQLAALHHSSRLGLRSKAQQLLVAIHSLTALGGKKSLLYVACFFA